MNKLFVLLCGIAAASAWAEQTPPGPALGREAWKEPGAFPEFVKQAVLDAPDDALAGIGVARIMSVAASVTTSTNRARVEIVRQLNAMAEDMVLNYAREAGADNSAAMSFLESMTRALANADVSKAKVAEQNTDSRRAVWTVVYMTKADAAGMLSQAAVSAKSAVPSMAAFDAGAGLDDAFAKIKSEQAAAGW